MGKEKGKGKIKGGREERGDGRDGRGKEGFEEDEVTHEQNI